MQLDVGLPPPLPTSNLGSAAAPGGKRIDPLPWPGFVLAQIEFGCLIKRQQQITCNRFQPYWVLSGR